MMEQIKTMWYDFVSPLKLLKWVEADGKSYVDNVILSNQTIATSEILQTFSARETYHHRVSRSDGGAKSHCRVVSAGGVCGCKSSILLLSNPVHTLFACPTNNISKCSKCIN